MRFYKIVTPNKTWDATNDPYALNVELNIPVTFEALPKSGALARIWGIDIQTILNAKSFNQQDISIYGGMQAGLPLANPAEQGLLVKGSIFPALGNWVGTDMTLDLYIVAPLGLPDPSKPANLTHQTQANQPLEQGIKKALSTAYPKLTPKININPALVVAYSVTGFYQTLEQYAQWVLGFSRSIINKSTYSGVHMWVQDTNLIVDDGTQTPGPKQVSYTDLVGQPIWTGINTAQFKTVMRGDLKLGDIITLPKTIATLGATSNNQYSSSGNIISGNFRIQSILHTGNFRQGDWSSWASTFDVIQQPSGSASSATPLVPGN